MSQETYATCDEYIIATGDDSSPDDRIRMMLESQSAKLRALVGIRSGEGLSEDARTLARDLDFPNIIGVFVHVEEDRGIVQRRHIRLADDDGAHRAADVLLPVIVAEHEVVFVFLEVIDGMGVFLPGDCQRLVK